MRFTAVINLPIILLGLAVGAAALPIMNPIKSEPLALGPSHFIHCAFLFRLARQHDSIQTIQMIPLIFKMHQLTR